MTLPEALAHVFDNEPVPIDWNWVFDIPDGWSDSYWVVVEGQVVTDPMEER